MMRIDTDGYPYVEKSPGDDLPYRVDFAGKVNEQDGAKTDWLDAGSAIASFAVAVTGPDALLIYDAGDSTLVDNNTAVMVWLQGGTPAAVRNDVQPAERYRVTVTITTNDSPPMVKEQSFNVHVVQR